MSRPCGAVKAGFDQSRHRVAGVAGYGRSRPAGLARQAWLFMARHGPVDVEWRGRRGPVGRGLDRLARMAWQAWQVVVSREEARCGRHG